MPSADPTLDFLATFEDPSQWVIVENVPICTPHERTVKGSDGAEQHIIVTEQDLPEIAHQLNSREVQYGVPAVVTIGHRQQTDPSFPEKNQPDIVGYARHHHVAPFGPSRIPAVMGTVYYKRSEWDEAKKYPFRSMDFYPNTKKVTGIALLKRDPYLPMGMVTYAMDGQEESYGASCYEQEPVGYKQWMAHFEHHCQAKPVMYSMPGRALRTAGRAAKEVAGVVVPPYGLLRSARRVAGYSNHLPPVSYSQVPTPSMAAPETPVFANGLLDGSIEYAYGLKTLGTLGGGLAGGAVGALGGPVSAVGGALAGGALGHKLGSIAGGPDSTTPSSPISQEDVNKRAKAVWDSQAPKPVTNANEANMPDPMAAAPEDAAPEAPPEAGAAAPPEGYDQWMACFEHACKTDPRLQAMCGGGEAGGEMPPAESGELGGAPAEPEMPKPGEQNAAIDRIGRAAQWASPAARVGAAANELSKGNIGRAAGEITGYRPAAKALLGEKAWGDSSTAAQDSAMPIAYAATVQHLQRQVAAIEKQMAGLQSENVALKGKSALKEAELLVYELANDGVLALYSGDKLDPVKFQAMTQHLAKLPEATRKARFEDIKANYAKDASIAYSSLGAPVGGFVGIPQTNRQPLPGEDKKMSAESLDKIMDKARQYQAQNPKKSWDDCVAYANGGVA